MLRIQVSPLSFIYSNTLRIPVKCTQRLRNRKHRLSQIDRRLNNNVYRVLKNLTLFQSLWFVDSVLPMLSIYKYPDRHCTNRLKNIQKTTLSHFNGQFKSTTKITLTLQHLRYVLKWQIAVIMLSNVHLRSNKTGTNQIKINVASLKQIYIFLCSFYFINFHVVLLFYGSSRFR